MRRLLACSAYGCLVALLLLFSCQKEISFEGGGVPGTGSTGGNGGGTGSGSGGSNPRRCVACTYLPFCDSSQFTYLLDSADTTSGVVRLLNDTLINGQNYTKVSGFAAFNTGLLYNCANQEYKMAFALSQFGLNADTIRAMLEPLLDSLLPGPVQPGSLLIPNVYYATILKANNAVGSTWLDTLTAVTFPVSAGPFTLNVRLYVGIEYKYMAKNVNHTVLGTAYSNVQYVQGKPKTGLATQLPVPLPVPLPSIDGQLDFYLAKDVGLIEMKASDSTGVLTAAKLVRYRL